MVVASAECWACRNSPAFRSTVKQMNVRLNIAPALLLTAAVLAGPALAGEPQEKPIPTLAPVHPELAPPVRQRVFRGYQADQLLALETGVRARDVRMIQNTLQSHANFRTRAEQKIGKRFAQALGEERYTTWANGRPIRLYSPEVINAANRMAGLAPEPSATEARVAIAP